MWCFRWFYSTAIASEGGGRHARDLGHGALSWPLLIDAFNTYCLRSRRHSEIVSEADQSSVNLEVGSEMCASLPCSVAVTSLYFLFNSPSPSLLSAAVFSLKGVREEGAK